MVSIQTSTSEELATPPVESKGRTSRWVVLVVVLVAVLALPLIRGYASYNYVLQVGMVVFMWIAMTSSW
ncbi:MAG: hypothetical protein GEU71_15550, partial [Actinobacteria bacterium]|nr:hypothetical protein [Actinomycetota bacterium]